MLAVVRSHPEWERPYTGIVSLQSGEIAEDLAKYLAESEQQNAAIALGVSINRDASIRAAGGYLIQVRVGCNLVAPWSFLEAGLRSMAQAQFSCQTHV